VKREWKPGDVALVPFDRPDDVPAMWMDGRGWVLSDGRGASENFTDVRPLVVIDPEDTESVERLAALWWDEVRKDMPHPGQRDKALAAALREFANPTPPKPEEPTGLGAVVEDDEGNRYVNALFGHDRHWVRSGPIVDGRTRLRDYADIAAVRVLSEGVS
jgi:hypothetical protein